MRKWVNGLEWAGGALVCLLAVATPWMFGTTERWSVELMNYGSYAAGLTLLAAAILNRLRGGDKLETSGGERTARLGFLAVNVLLLAFCLVAYFNARAIFLPDEQSFAYRDYVSWLPTTYDAPLTRDTFFTLLGCFAAFWGGRYWLMRGWERAVNSRSGGALATAMSNRRLVLFLWVLSLNGMLVSVQGILQRLSNSPKLLWLRMSYWGDPASCFGPFAYRGNAADYLNLMWPVAVGFWWALMRERRRVQGGGRLLTDGPEMVLIPAAAIILAGTVVCASRGGVAIAAGLLLGVGLVFTLQKNARKAIKWAGMALLAGLLVFLSATGWKDLANRLRNAPLEDMSGRVEIYQNAQKIAVDFPIFGTGPGTFRAVYHLYREDPNQPWHGFLHDDWLETRVTFGWVGFGLVLLQLVLLVCWALSKGKAPVQRITFACLGLSLAGCLGHAKYDFPFQTYSILFTFVVVAMAWTTLSPERE